MKNKKSRTPVLFLFGLIFALEFGVGYYLAHIYGFMSGDASSRVANAFYVIYSTHPALANIGFVWNPLPSILELVPLLLYPIYHPVASSGLAAVLMTSLFAAWSGVTIYKLGEDFGLRPGVNASFVAMYAFNPYIFYYGANGLTEAVFIAFVQLAVACFLRWMRKPEINQLIVIAFSIALAFWTRYETVTFGAGLALAAGLWTWFSSRESRRERRLEIEGTTTLLLAPVVFSGLLWIFFNYSIMGDALYFLTSSYSNLGQAELIKNDPVFSALTGHPLLTAAFVAKKLVYFCIPLVVVFVFRVMEQRARQIDFAILLILVFSIPFMQYFLLLRGGSAAWIRYYMYPFPILAAWIPYEISRLKHKKSGTALLMTGMIASGVVMGLMMSDPRVASDEYEAFQKSNLYSEQQADKEVAAYINANLQDSSILTDSFSSFRIVMGSDRPRNFILTSDSRFKKALESPASSDADFVLIPNPQAVLALDAFNQRYPNLYADGASWARLEREFSGYWKLYRIVRSGGDAAVRSDSDAAGEKMHG